MTQVSAETWKAVPEFPDYEVSDHGRVRSWRPLRNGSAAPLEPRVLKLDESQRYLAVKLCAPGQRPLKKVVHRLVLEVFVGPPGPGMQALHGPGGKRDNRLANLRRGTSKENGEDKVRFGESARGERNANSKMDEHIVRFARSSGLGCAAVARMCRVSKQSARDMLNRKTWKWVV